MHTNQVWQCSVLVEWVIPQPGEMMFKRCNEVDAYYWKFLLNETMLVSRAVHFTLEDSFEAGCYFGFISFSYCLVGKEEKKLINCTTINLWYDMAWAVITHSEKQFTNSSKNSIGKILSVKMIILCIISI